MTRATQAVLTCDRCGASITTRVGTRKYPDGWVRMDALVDSGSGAYIAIVDFCPECVQSACAWYADARPKRLTAGAQ